MFNLCLIITFVVNAKNKRKKCFTFNKYFNMTLEKVMLYIIFINHARYCKNKLSVGVKFLPPSTTPLPLGNLLFLKRTVRKIEYP